MSLSRKLPRQHPFVSLQNVNYLQIPGIKRFSY